MILINAFLPYLDIFRTLEALTGAFQSEKKGFLARGECCFSSMEHPSDRYSSTIDPFCRQQQKRNQKKGFYKNQINAFDK